LAPKVCFISAEVAREIASSDTFHHRS
jgi:hypothetical protein